MSAFYEDRIFGTGFHYDIKMKDDITINLTSEYSNKAYIYLIENKLKKGIPHVIEKDEYEYIKDEHPYLLYLYDNFTIE